MKNQIDDNLLIDLYCNNAMSISQIAKNNNCYEELISNKLKRLKIPIRSGNFKGYYFNREKDKDNCFVCGEGNTTEYDNSGKFYCKRHYSQMREYGKILSRTKFDFNEVIFADEFYTMYLYDESHNVVGETYFDKEDYKKVVKHKWHMDRQGYIVTNTKDKGAIRRLTMHRYIINAFENQLVDHINQNKSDNRRFNLRIVDKSKNELNKPITIHNTSGVRGVSFYKSKDKWVAEISINGSKQRKNFKCFDDAVQQRLIFESKYSKEYAYNYNHETKTIQLTYLSHDDNKQTYIEVDMEGNILKFEKVA